MFKSSKATTPEELFALIDEPRKSEMLELHKLILKTVPKLKPKMYGSIIGYGEYTYKYASGRTGEWMIIGLASQKNYISLYICAVEGKEYVAEKHKAEFPKASIGKSCIRFKKIEDIDTKALTNLLLKAEKLGGMFAA